MNKLKHTLGPWYVKGAQIYGPDNKSVYSHTREINEHKANLCLISAAPDLLAACEEVIFRITVGDKLETLEPWAKEIVDICQKAIAKAEGTT